MQLIKTLKWHEPLAVASNVKKDEKYWAFLYSGMEQDSDAKFSFLALDAKETIRSDNFDKLERNLSSDKEKYQNSWFGYLSYDLKNSLEKLNKDKNGYLNSPELFFINYNVVMIFNKQEQSINVYSSSSNYEEIAYLFADNTIKTDVDVRIPSLNSNMTKGEYLQKVASIKDSIFSGEIYQANLTRKFYGEFEKVVDNFEIFTKLCKISPSSYSAYLKFDNFSVISSSPERFIKIDDKKNVSTIPIKGSIARNLQDAKLDEFNKQKLQNSIKDKSENLMIVDLCRNDLSRTCKIGSVKVNDLFKVVSYSTVHHMLSSVTGVIDDKYSSLDLIKKSFPAGSMTGAPKIMAMNICSNQEKIKRGIYAGALGWFAGDGSVDLSVIIRTLIITNKYFEFQVGGAIVADSDPIAEWQETLIKAKAICKTLNIAYNKISCL